MQSDPNWFYTKTKPELSKERERELNRQLDILHNLTYNSYMARRNRAQVTITYFRVCDDNQNKAYGIAGQCLNVTGVCRYVDPDITQTIRVDDVILAFEDILDIDSPGGTFSVTRSETSE